MNHITAFPAAHAVPFRTTRFEAFQVADTGPNRPIWRTYARGELEASTLEEALNEALAGTAFSHKDQLLIREEGEQGILLHLYAVRRKSTPRYVYENHVQRRVNDLYAAHVSTFDGSVLAGVTQGLGGGNVAQMPR